MLVQILWKCIQDNNRISETYTGTYYIEASIHIVNGAMLSIDGSLTNSDIDPCETLLMVSTRPFTYPHFSIANVTTFPW